ncbi:glycosyltransferase family 4 protein, partial [Patescibacteria group bacterium]|nr:glycosyltransferase family 4 protein [Patescibacteria group bacterium]
YARFISISHAQAQLNPELPFVATVYNGIRVDRFDFNGSPGEYVVFLGRISPEKGTRQAILAAQKAGVPIVLAAKVDTVDRAYFNLEVKPLIDNDQVQYVGEVDHEQKNRILRNARALLTLIQWEEPFGLVMAEAFACGTPVIAIPRGSVPEIVEDGKTGFLVKDVDEAAEAIRKVDQIDRQACRKVAEERFSTEIMVDNYVKAYQQVIEGWRK